VLVDICGLVHAIFIDNSVINKTTSEFTVRLAHSSEKIRMQNSAA
jgi:hypothetical protein